MTKMMTYVAVACLAVGFASASVAQEVILEVTQGEDVQGFDRAALSAIGLESFETTTIWSEGPQVFEGVPLYLLMAHLDVSDGMLRATAINDYTVEIPVSDAVADGPMVAMLLNGEEMSVRDKGPLWIVYPYDLNADYRSEVIYSRSIWQLDRIEVVQ